MPVATHHLGSAHGAARAQRGITLMPAPASGPPHIPSDARSGPASSYAALVQASGTSERRATLQPVAPLSPARTELGEPGDPAAPTRASGHSDTHSFVSSPGLTASPLSLSSNQTVHPPTPSRRPYVQFGSYLLLHTLGEGQFGKVKLGIRIGHGDEVAVKLMRRTDHSNDTKWERVTKETELLKRLKHPNIVGLFEVIQSERYMGIVLEYASGGELFDYILSQRFLREKEARRIFAQLISAVWYMHANGVVHRDLKLENVLLDHHRNILITDFGFAGLFDVSNKGTGTLMATSCGSPCYAAPELVIQEDPYDAPLVDVWSCGVILYAMLSGYLPFDDDPTNPDSSNIHQLYRYIMRGPLSFPDHVAAEPRDLLARVLAPLPAKRASIPEVMKHSWLSPYAELFKFTADELEQAAHAQQARRQTHSRAQGAGVSAGVPRTPSSAHTKPTASRTEPAATSPTRQITPPLLSPRLSITSPTRDDIPDSARPDSVTIQPPEDHEKGSLSPQPPSHSNSGNELAHSSSSSSVRSPTSSLHGRNSPSLLSPGSATVRSPRTGSFHSSPHMLPPQPGPPPEFPPPQQPAVQSAVPASTSSRIDRISSTRQSTKEPPAPTSPVNKNDTTPETARPVHAHRSNSADVGRASVAPSERPHAHLPVVPGQTMALEEDLSARDPITSPSTRRFRRHTLGSATHNSLPVLDEAPSQTDQWVAGRPENEHNGPSHPPPTWSSTGSPPFRSASWRETSPSRFSSWKERAQRSRSGTVTQTHASPRVSPVLEASPPSTVSHSLHPGPLDDHDGHHHHHQYHQHIVVSRPGSAAPPDGRQDLGTRTPSSTVDQAAGRWTPLPRPADPWAQPLSPRSVKNHRRATAQPSVTVHSTAAVSLEQDRAPSRAPAHKPSTLPVPAGATAQTTPTRGRPRSKSNLERIKALFSPLLHHEHSHHGSKSSVSPTPPAPKSPVRAEPKQSVDALQPSPEPLTPVSPSTGTTRSESKPRTWTALVKEKVGGSVAVTKNSPKTSTSPPRRPPSPKAQSDHRVAPSSSPYSNGPMSARTSTRGGWFKQLMHPHENDQQLNQAHVTPRSSSGASGLTRPRASTVAVTASLGQHVGSLTPSVSRPTLPLSSSTRGTAAIGSSPSPSYSTPTRNTTQLTDETRAGSLAAEIEEKEKLRPHEGQLKEEGLCSLPLQTMIERVATALAEMEAEVHCPEPYVWACRWRDPYGDLHHPHSRSKGKGGSSTSSMVVFALEVFRVAKIPGLTSIDMRHLAGNADAFASAQQVFYVRCDLSSPPAVDTPHTG